MSFSFTTEAVQCQLGTLGIILWPSMTGNPVNMINDEDIENLGLRIFPNPNLAAPLYTYTYNAQQHRWFLDEVWGED